MKEIITGRITLVMFRTFSPQMPTIPAVNFWFLQILTKIRKTTEFTY